MLRTKRVQVRPVVRKSMGDMTNKELGGLFPIIIAEPDCRWPKLFEREKNKIRRALGKQNIIRIEHIGSTAIPRLRAKPTIDILLEVPGLMDRDGAVKKLKKLGYHYIPKPENPPPHMMFAKGYTIHGFKGQAYHIHVRYRGDWDELYFRNYLRSHPDVVQAYGELKVRLSKTHRNDREVYTDKKNSFIKRITRIARREKAK